MQNNYEYSDIVYLSNFFAIDRAIIIFKYLLFGLVSNIVYIIALFMMLFVFLDKKNRVILSYYNISFILNFLLIFSFYIFTSLPLEWHLKVSVERVFFEVLGIYFIPIVIFINIYSKKIFK